MDLQDWSGEIEERCFLEKKKKKKPQEKSSYSVYH